MFKLVNGSASRRFGVVLADKNTGMMESGAWSLLMWGGACAYWCATCPLAGIYLNLCLYALFFVCRAVSCLAQLARLAPLGPSPIPMKMHPVLLLQLFLFLPLADSSRLPGGADALCGCARAAPSLH